jgi:hypothetical protein
MKASADGLLALADEAERRREFPIATACLEAILRTPHAASGFLLCGPTLLWTCNFQAQLASALAIDRDAPSVLSAVFTGAAATTDLARKHD